MSEREQRLTDAERATLRRSSTLPRLEQLDGALRSLRVAQLPALTAPELTVLLSAVDSRRMALQAGLTARARSDEEIAVLWSLSTAISETLITALRESGWPQ